MCKTVFSLPSTVAGIMRRLKTSDPVVLAGSILAVFLLSPAGDALAGGGRDENVTTSVTVPERTEDATAAVGSQGLRVYRDPRTGQLGPPPPGMKFPALSAAELRMLNRSDTGLQARLLPGGGVAVDLQGRYRNMVVTTIDARGSAAVNCAQTPAQAAVVLQRGERHLDETAD
jgi:hypothetical protein